MTAWRNKSRIMDLWRFAKSASEEFDNIDQFMKKSGYDAETDGEIINFSPINNITDYGYSVVLEDRVIFAFRGTKGKVESWLENFDMWPLRLDKDQFNKKHLQDGGGTIHDGFYDGFQHFKKMVNETMTGCMNIPVFCTGHSRGGALSTLCARHVAKNLNKASSNIAFAAPKQGTNAYRDEFNLLPVDSTTIINGPDIVPTLPPDAFGFRHVGKIIQLEQPFWVNILPSSRIKCHYPDGRPESYDVALKKFMAKRSK